MDSKMRTFQIWFSVTSLKFHHPGLVKNPRHTRILEPDQLLSDRREGLTSCRSHFPEPSLLFADSIALARSINTELRTVQTNKMSRFFHGGSDSDTSTSDEEELYSEEEEELSEEESSEEETESESESSEEETTGRTGASRFMRDVSDSEESEDEDRVTVVKSAKDKRWEELEAIVKSIENAEKINDWAVIATGGFFFFFFFFE